MIAIHVVWMELICSSDRVSCTLFRPSFIECASSDHQIVRSVSALSSVLFVFIGILSLFCDVLVQITAKVRVEMNHNKPIDATKKDI